MNWTTLAIIASYLVIVNLIGFFSYGLDKAKAKKDVRRIPEKTLLNMARLGGGLGCWIGMKVFHHKTLHRQFRIIVPIWTIIWVGLIVLLLVKL